MPISAPIYASLSDPIDRSPLLAAALWVQGTLLGTIATSVAIIAVGAAGAAMLLGRLNIRRGSTVVWGCFILFGAPTIAVGIRSALSQGDAPQTASYTPAVPPPALTTATSPFDPYAGAAVPVAR